MTVKPERRFIVEPGPRRTSPAHHRFRLVWLLGVLLAGWSGADVGWGDVLELTSGARVQGSVVARDEQSITFAASIAGRTYTRKYPLERIRAVTVGDQREVIQQTPETSGSGTAGETTASRTGERRTKAEVEALIERLGRTPPDWWDSVPLNYPKTLDLSWPLKPSGGWNNQKNVGQYLWDVINPNPDRWREGVRLVHHLLTLHQDDPEKRNRAMRTLARMYQDLLQDYARAAFWWRSAGVDGGRDYAGLQLAECYWKLGSKSMALEQLQKTPVQFATIKLLADMGELRQALAIADANLRGEGAYLAGIYAGDACRAAGRYDLAVKYYEGVLALSATGRAKDRIARSQQRARANLEAIRLFDTLDLRRVPDGTYRSSSLGYEAPVEVEVVVGGGRIEAVRVVRHREKQFYSSLTETPARIVEKQGVRGVDTTSGATITSEAIINATAKALSEAMQ